MTSAPAIHLRYGLEENQRWLMELEDVPETLLHDLIIELLKLVLKHRFRNRNALIASNMACRWDPDDHRVGVDPDIILVDPAPPEGDALKSLQVWRPDHHAPKLAIEVVSETNAVKDYVEGPARLARLGAEELWIFDPELHGPEINGGPFALQIWRRLASGDHVEMEQVHAGNTPAYSTVLDAWVVTTDGGMRLRISDDADRTKMWPTHAEAAESRVAEAEAEIQRLRGKLSLND